MILMILILALSGCGNNNGNTSPTDVPSTVPEVMTPTPIPTSVPTKIPEPTATPTPSPTPIPLIRDSLTETEFKNIYEYTDFTTDMSSTGGFSDAELVGKKLVFVYPEYYSKDYVSPYEDDTYEGNPDGDGYYGDESDGDGYYGDESDGDDYYGDDSYGDDYYGDEYYGDYDYSYTSTYNENVSSDFVMEITDLTTGVKSSETLNLKGFYNSYFQLNAVDDDTFCISNDESCFYFFDTSLNPVGSILVDNIDSSVRISILDRYNHDVYCLTDDSRILKFRLNGSAPETLVSDECLEEVYGLTNFGPNYLKYSIYDYRNDSDSNYLVNKSTGAVTQYETDGINGRLAFSFSPDGSMLTMVDTMKDNVSVYSIPEDIELPDFLSGIVATVPEVEVYGNVAAEAAASPSPDISEDSDDASTSENGDISNDSDDASTNENGDNLSEDDPFAPLYKVELATSYENEADNVTVDYEKKLLLTCSSEYMNMLEINTHRSYDLTTGSLISSAAERIDNSYTGSESMLHTGEGLLFTIYNQPENRLFVWDYTTNDLDDISPVYVRTNYLPVYLDSYRKELEQKYNMYIYLGAEVGGVLGGYSMTPSYDYDGMYNALKTLDKTLGLYPEKFFDQFLYGTVKTLGVYLCSGFTKTNEYNADNAIAVASSYHYEKLLAIDINYVDDNLSQNIVHEISHWIDSYIEDRQLAEDRTDFDDNWFELCPADFKYLYSYTSTRFSWKYIYDEYSNPDGYYADSYSQTYPTEDRARLFEYLIYPGYASYFESPYMRAKLHFYFDYIREYFDTDGWPEQTFWEEKLAIEDDKFDVSEE